MNLSSLGVSQIWQPASDEKYLMVVLHGRGDSAEGFEWLQKKLKLPGLSVLLINAPDDYYGGYSWYDLPPHQEPGIIRSRGLLARVFDELEKQGTSSEKCFLFGFSQGCLMTLEFGGRYSKRLAGYIGVSGYCLDEVRLIAEASPAALNGDWLITHGTEDEVLPVERTRGQMEALKTAGFRLEYREYPKNHTIDPFHEISFIREWLRERIL